MRLLFVGMITMLFSPQAEARVGRSLLEGEVAFACRSTSPAPRREYLVIQNNAAIEDGRASPRSGVVVILANSKMGESTSVRMLEARLKNDKHDPSFIGFVYNTNEALRINTGNPSHSELVMRKQDGVAAELSTQTYPLACTIAKIAVHAAKKKKKNSDAATARAVTSRDLPERQPARVKVKPRK